MGLYFGFPLEMLAVMNIPPLLPQNPLLEGKDLSTYIGPTSIKPGSGDSGTSFAKWQKQGVGELGYSNSKVVGLNCWG